MTETPVAGATPAIIANPAGGSAVGARLNLTVPAVQATQEPAQQGQPAYPANTPVEQMKPEEQASYWRDVARKHEKAWQGRLGRDVDPDTYSAQLVELEKLRGEVGTETDRKIAQARKEERAAVAAEYGPKLVRTALSASLAGMAEADRTELLDTINPAVFLTTEGDVDTAKVQAFITKFVQSAGKAAGGHIADHGGGKRSTTMLSPREAGLAEAKRRFGDKVPSVAT